MSWTGCWVLEPLVEGKWDLQTPNQRAWRFPVPNQEASHRSPGLPATERHLDQQAAEFGQGEIERVTGSGAACIKKYTSPCLGSYHEVEDKKKDKLETHQRLALVVL